MENKSITAIERIKRKLDLNEMSVLVGAGFSKNIDPKAFLSWWELLKPMVLFLFEDDIELAYNSIANSKKKKSWANFVDDQVYYYIKKIGYTQIATLYAERKGNLESITAFIEAHTPWVKVHSNGEKDLVIGQSGTFIKKLTDDRLSQHELLLSLNWNNIYTTNYDNTLECVLDQEGREDLDLKCKQTADKVRKIESELTIVEKEHIDLMKELNSEESSKSPNNDKIKDIRNKVFYKNLALNSLKAELDRNRQNFLLLENALHDIINVVENSSELSIRRNKNIIKLHGSLRCIGENKQYGFDGDNRNQYIFSEDSYKQYPLKHEAFTNLMRISLLQESFLLIGFSGVDPNFTEWIKWVRDVIEVKQKDNTNNYKIYLIDLENAPLSDDLQLYYENHNIFRIQLMDNEVITFLESQLPNDIESDKSCRYAINLLLKYFSTHIQSLAIKLALTQFESNSISALINKIAHSPLTFENKIGLFIDLAKNSNGKEDIIKYIKLDTSETINFIRILQDLYNKNTISLPKDLSEEDKEYLLKSVCIIIEILNLPIYNIFNKAQQQALKKEIEKTNNQNLTNYYLSLREKSLVFQNTSQKTYRNPIYRAYDFMYKLNNYDLFKHISKWHPENEEELFTKLSIQYLFNQIDSSAYLSFEDILKKGSLNTYLKYIKLAKIILNKELYYNGAIDVIKKNGLNRLKSLLDVKIKYLERNGILSGEQRIEEYIKLLEPKEKIEKYGKNRFSTSKTTYIGGTPDDKIILAVIQSLFSFHKYTATQYIYDIDPLKWYEITKKLLNTYPYPIIFYSLCKGNKELLQRIGKDLGFVKEKENILRALMHIFEFDPKNLPNKYQFRVNILVLASEMLHTIDNKVWDSFFSKYWKLHKNTILKDISGHDGYAEFAYSGLLYTSNVEQVILDISTIIQDINYKDEYQILPNLMTKIEGNINFKKSTQIDNLYRTLILKAKAYNHKYVWIISSFLFDILSASSKKELKKLIIKTNFEKGMQNHYFSDVVFNFSKKDKNLRTQFEHTVFTPKRLWDTGYSKSGDKFIYQSRETTLFYLERFAVQLDRLIAERSPVINDLYHSLHDIYYLINKVSEQRLPFDDNFDTQLRNVIFFLNRLKVNAYETDGISLSDIEQQLNNFQKLAIIPISQHEIRQMLSSKEKEDFNEALKALNYEIFRIKRNIVDFQFEINLIFGRLISVDDTFESGLGYITNWTLNKREEFILLFKDSLFLLIENYSNFETYPEEVDKIYVIQHLTVIAIAIEKEPGVKSEIVSLFIAKAKKLNFNIIKKAILDAKYIMKKENS